MSLPFLRRFALASMVIFLLSPFASGGELIERVQLDVVVEGYDGSFCWFHPRAASVPVPGSEESPQIVMTMQKWFTSASDYFSGLSVVQSRDLGANWTAPKAIDALAWRQETDDVIVGVCDFTPGWHRASQRVLGIGHTVRYKNEKLHPEPRPRETAYSVWDPATEVWTPWRVLEMPEEERFFSAGSGCGQWLEEEDGTVLVPFYFKGKADSKQQGIYSSAVLRCAFDGETLRVLEMGTPIEHDTPRGVYEPSLARYQGRYFITLRNDDRGYVAVSDDGLHFGPKQPWTFDDGEELGSYNTQQHWVSHSEGLFLSYTRKGADNDHIMRHRAPLFLAQVDAERLTVLRETERIIVPERGATLGNFGVVTVNEHESWVTVGEGMSNAHRSGGDANGRVYAARIIWARPNTL